MNGCRWQVWSTLTVLALLWTCGLPILIVAQYQSHTPKIDSSAHIFYAVTDLLWVGIPVTGVCAFFGYRNSRYWREWRRYKDIKDAQENKAEMQEWHAIAHMQKVEQRAAANFDPPSSAQRAKLEAAQMLIQEKKYETARAVLKTIVHPEATAYLEQIDRLSQ